jgi:hypothetical protein
MTASAISRPHRLLIPLAALLAVHPLIVHGCSCGHDFDFHILNWFEAAQQLVRLHFPQWANTPAYNAGEPRFVFYPPLSWLIGATLGLILPWTVTPVVFTWLALTLSGFTMHRLASRYAGPTAALLAAIFYLANPYMLFTAFERTAYAELLAAAWIPLLLAAAFAETPSILGIATPVALLWLTNAPAAVMCTYALALITLLRLGGRLGGPSFAGFIGKGWGAFPAATTKFAATIAAGTLLGLALPAFYLLPAAYEQRYVTVAMAVIPGMRIVDNTLFHHTADAPHDAVLQTASILAILLLTLTALALTRKSSLRASLAILTAIIAFLLTPLSLPIWHHAPELAFLQFPWRILAILAAILSLAIALAFDRLKPNILGLTAVVLALALAVPAYRAFAQPCDPSDTVAARLALFHSTTGSDPTDEYTPAPADNDSLQHADPPFWLTPPQSPDTQPDQTHPGPAPRHLTLDLPAPQVLVLNLRDYPAWRIARNGTPVTHRIQRNDDLVAIPLPAGPSTIDIAESHPADRILGDVLSCAALLAAAALRRHRKAAPAALA